MPITTANQLADFVRTNFSYTIARTHLLESSSAPLDYLAHTFFDRGDAVVWANRGGGKTALGAIATALDLLHKPGIQVRILGGSLDQSARMYEHLLQIFSHDRYKPHIQGRITRRAITLTNGSRAELLAQSETSVRGTRVQKVRCDEVDLFSRDVWAAAQLTTRSLKADGPDKPAIRASIDALSTMQRPYGVMWDVVSQSAFSSSTPATSPRRLFRWGVIDSLEHCPPQHTCHTCPLHTDCRGLAKLRAPAEAGHISIEDALDQHARVSRAVWDAEMLCLRPRRDNTVFPEFKEEAHTFGNPTEPLNARSLPDHPASPEALAGSAPLYCGMDFGFRNDTAVLWCTRDSAGTVRVVAELVTNGHPVHHYISAIKASPLGLPLFLAVDPAGEQHSFQTGTCVSGDLRNAGFPVRSRPSQILFGLDLIRARLAPAQGPPTLLIHKRCRRLIESLHRYHYDEDRPTSLSPVKDGFDHTIDALRYLLLHLDTPYVTKASRY